MWPNKHFFYFFFSLWITISLIKSDSKTWKLLFCKFPEDLFCGDTAFWRILESRRYSLKSNDSSSSSSSHHWRPPQKMKISTWYSFTPTFFLFFCLIHDREVVLIQVVIYPRWAEDLAEGGWGWVEDGVEKVKGNKQVTLEKYLICH